jgi:hypothetical protein
VAGREKYARKLAKHLDEPIDAACIVSKPGTTVAAAATAGIGGAVGAAIATAATPTPRRGDLNLPPTMALALGPSSFKLVKLGAMTGGPKETVGSFPYAETSAVTLDEKKITTRVTLAFGDGSDLHLEAKRVGANKPNIEVLELLRERCG